MLTIPLGLVVAYVVRRRCQRLRSQPGRGRASLKSAGGGEGIVPQAHRLLDARPEESYCPMADRFACRSYPKAYLATPETSCFETRSVLALLT